MLLDPDKISKNRDNFRILVCVTEGSVSRNNFYYILSGHTTNRHFLKKHLDELILQRPTFFKLNKIRAKNLQTLSFRCLRNKY